MIENKKTKVNKKTKNSNRKKNNDADHDRHLSKRSKTSSKQIKSNEKLTEKETKNIQSESSKIAPTLIKSTIFNCGYKININNLSMNMIGYLSDFLNLPELFQFGKINKRLNIFIKKTSKMFILYKQIKQYCNNHNFLTLADLLNSDASFLLYIQQAMTKKYTIQQTAHIITQLLFSFCEGTELDLNTPSSTILYFLKDLLTSDICPFSSVILNNSSHSKDFSEHLSFIFELNTNVKRISIYGFIFNKIDLTKAFSKLSLSSCVIKKLTIIPNNEEYFKDSDLIDFNEKNYVSLFNSLALNTSITNLWLFLNTKVWNPNINKIFIIFIKNNKTIKNLRLNYEIDPIWNYDFLRLTESIETLELSGISIEADGFKALERGLSLRSIEDLPASINKVNTLIFRNFPFEFFYNDCIFSILNSNPNITKLNLSNNFIYGFCSLELFCDFMKSNTSLKSLTMNNAGVEESNLRLILNMMRINRTLEEIDLTVNDICNCEIFIDEIVEVIQENLSIKNFKFCICQKCSDINSTINKILGPRLFEKIEEIKIWVE